MPFATQCPDCQANLTLDAAPEPGAPVECPRCGSTFAPPKLTKKKKAADAPKKPGGDKPKKRKMKVRRTNPVLLLIAIGIGFAGLIGVGALMIYFVNKAGKVEEMLAQVPGDFNWARGVNTGQLAKYPGYAAEVDRFMTAEVKGAASELAKAARQSDAGFVDYLLIARNKGAGKAVASLFIFRTSKPFSADQVGKSLGGSPFGGANGVKLPPSAPGGLAGAVLLMPTNRLMVIVPAGGPQDAVARASAAASQDSSRKSSFAGSLTDTSRVVTRGSIWLIVRCTGGLKDFNKAMFSGVADDFKQLNEAAKTSTSFGLWTSPGGSGVRFGAGLECASPKDASALVRGMYDGPLGKGDESEPTNQLKSAMSGVTDKRLWSEMMQMMEFRSKGACAYLVTTLTDERARNMMGTFNNPSLATEEPQFTQPQFGGGAAGGAGDTPPQRGGPTRGGVGGVAPPSLAGPGG